MKPVRTLASIMVATCLAGCAATRSTKSHREASRLAAERIHVPVAWDRGTPDDARVDERVEQLLAHELTVDGAVEIAMVRNPRLLATFEEIGIAQADLVQAGLIDNLHVGGGPRFPISGGAPGWEGDAAINLLQVVLVPLRRKVAKAGLRDATLAVAQGVLELDQAVRSAFYETIASERLLEFRRGIAELTEALTDLAGRQVDAGSDGTLTELERADRVAIEAGARMSWQQAEMDAIERREHLVRLLGVWGEDVDVELQETLPGLPEREPDLADLERVAIRRRFDLQSERARVDALVHAVKLARRVSFVDVQVGVIGEADPNDGPSLGPFFELELPIFDWGQAEVARAEASLRSVERRLQGMAIDARSEVRLARARMVTARRLVEFERDRVIPIRKRMVDLGQERYDAMLLGVYELVELKIDEYEAEAHFVEHLRDYWLARTELELAIAGRLAASAPTGADLPLASEDPTT